MQERKYGVERLLKSLEQNIDNTNLHVLAGLLNYHEPQLKEDLAAIKEVVVLNKDEMEEK